MKIQIDGKVYAYLVSKVAEIKAMVNGLGIMLDHAMEQATGPGAESVMYDEFKKIAAHLDDLQHILSGGVLD